MAARLHLYNNLVIGCLKSKMQGVGANVTYTNYGTLSAAIVDNLDFYISK